MNLFNLKKAIIAIAPSNLSISTLPVIIIIIYLFFFSLFCDAAVNYQLSIQDPATNSLEWMINFYDLLMADLVLVLVVIFFLILTLVLDPIHHKNSNSYFSHSQNLEIFWTIVPALILLSIAYPSFNLLYSLDDFTDPIFTIKIIGHQWYWSYEFLDVEFKSHTFDSYMVPTEDLFLGEFRLLTTDTTLTLPKSVPLRLLISSADVLHSWSVPSFGIKVDACPGRLTEAGLQVKRKGLYFGQCSEICGVNHGFMPIMVKVVSTQTWLDSILAEVECEKTPFTPKSKVLRFETNMKYLVEKNKVGQKKDELEAIFKMAATEKKSEDVPSVASVSGSRGISMHQSVPILEEQPVSVIKPAPEPSDPAVDLKQRKQYNKFLERKLEPELKVERDKYQAAGKEIPPLSEVIANAEGAGVYILPSERKPPVEVVEYGDIQNFNPRPASPDQKADFIPKPQISVARGKVDPSLAFSLMKANSQSGLFFETPPSSSPELTVEQVELRKQLHAELKDTVQVKKDLKNPYIRKFYEQLGPHTYENLAKIRPKPFNTQGSISTTSTSDSDSEGE